MFLAGQMMRCALAVAAALENRTMALPLTTDQPDRSVAPDERTIARDFILARLGSLFAFAPVGVWTVVHLWHQLAAYQSPQAWETAVTAHVNVASTVLVFVLVLGPLLWHTIWGILRMLRSRPRPLESGFSNLRYLLQRLSAVGLLFFLGAHLYLAWFEPRSEEHTSELQSRLHLVCRLLLEKKKNIL